MRRGRLWDRLEFGQRWRRRRRRRGRSARIWRWRSGRRAICARDNPVGLRRTPRARAGARGRCALLALLALRARARGAWFWRCRLIARGRIIWLRQRLWIARGRILWRILRRLFELLFSPQMRRRVRRKAPLIEFSAFRDDCTLRERVVKFPALVAFRIANKDAFLHVGRQPFVFVLLDVHIRSGARRPASVHATARRVSRLDTQR